MARIAVGGFHHETNCFVPVHTDFEPIAERVLVAIAPGAHLVDARKYPYQHLRAGVRLEPLGPAFEPRAS